MGQIPGCHGHGQCLTPPPKLAVHLAHVIKDIQACFAKLAVHLAYVIIDIQACFAR